MLKWLLFLALFVWTYLMVTAPYKNDFDDVEPMVQPIPLEDSVAITSFALHN